MDDAVMTPVEIGRELRRLRDAAGLKGREVGAALDVDKAAVSQWESGQSSPRLDKIGRLDALYGGRGEVLALYGINLRDAEISDLREQVADLARDLADQGKRISPSKRNQSTMRRSFELRK